MKSLSGILFPVAVVGLTAAGVLGMGKPAVHTYTVPEPVADTVIYTRDAYKLGRIGDFDEVRLSDSLLAAAAAQAIDRSDSLDSIPRITARDTMVVPDSLRYTDPFRFKYYVALVDSFIHTVVRDSLFARYDSLRIEADTLYARIPPDSLRGDSLMYLARLDSIDWRRVDSIYLADSAAVAQAKFLAWYNSLSPRERRKYDAEQALPRKLAEMDSLRRLEEEKKAIRDSITEYRPRILETFALPKEMQYKRIIEWQADQDFHRIEAREIDTSYNYHFNDYPIFRNDVNATWLGVSGSAMQYYNWFKRESDERVSFYDALEPWSFSPRTLPQYNTKTPYTELSYYGTILAGDAKESDILHLLTTQNISPALNLTISFDRYGGGGMLENETTKNKTFAARLNYLGQRYMAHFGYISNVVDQNENGGISDRTWIRDTTIEVREIPVRLAKAASTTKKYTFYLDQQYSIPFEFIKDLLAKKDTTSSQPASRDADTGASSVPADTLDAAAAPPPPAIDTVDRNVTTAYIGHSSEWSRYSRKYTDVLSYSDEAASSLYNNTFLFGNESADSLGTMKLDNKLFVRLQPWGSQAVVSKLSFGVGDELRHYFDSSSIRPQKHIENSFYIYAGAEGSYKKYFSWDATAKFNVLGYKAGDYEIKGRAKFSFYPFRRARTSPVTISAAVSNNLLMPDYYQRVLRTNHYEWENDFSRISTTRISGAIDIPYWKMNAEVGYALLANNIYYDTLGIVRQNTAPMSVISASLRKEFVFGPVHLDNRVLVQYSSNQEVVPLPLIALNLRWFAQFDVKPGVLQMQIGINGYYNTLWYSPAWNPALGVFQSQNQRQYNNGPYFDAFVNMQWKKVCIFIKYQNVGRGWPMQKKDYFTADRYIYTTDGIEGLKLGITWPFYFSTKRLNTSSELTGGGGRSSGGSSGSSSMGGGIGGGRSTATR